MATKTKVTAVQFRHCTTAELATYIGLPREVVINTDNWNFYVHDGVTPGGHPAVGDDGPAGPASTVPGPKGDKPVHTWTGTALSFENSDGSPGVAIDLKGPEGPASTVPGPEGPVSTVPGPEGPASTVPGPNGDKPAHTWAGTALAFENPDGSPGVAIDLKGAAGADSVVPGPEGPVSIIPGPEGPVSTVPGPNGDKPAHVWAGTTLSFENPDGSAGSIVDLKGNTGADSTVPGPQGDSFTVDASGLFSTKSTYDAELTGYSFLATDTSNLYVKNSDTSGDWSSAISFGKGETGADSTVPGPKGDTGSGVAFGNNLTNYATPETIGDIYYHESGTIYQVTGVGSWIVIGSWEGTPGETGPAVTDASTLTTGTLPDARLPARLGVSAKRITDWNDAVQNGYYMDDDALNAPGAGWFLGHVVAHSSTWCTQTVHAFTADGGVDSKTYRRDQNSGAWSAWYRVRDNEAELNLLYAKLAHTHATANVTGLDTALSGKSPTGHTHTTANVSGLDTALSGKAATSHSHTIANVTNLQTSLNAKQATLVSGANVKSINGTSLLGSGNLVVGGEVEEAPTDGKQYVRQDSNWVPPELQIKEVNKSLIPTLSAADARVFNSAQASGSFPGWRAFDGTTGNAFISYSVPTYVGWDFENITQVTGYTIQCAEAHSVQASNNGSTWTTLGSYPGNSVGTYTEINLAEYSMYKVVSNTNMNIATFKLHGYVEDPLAWSVISDVPSAAALSFTETGLAASGYNEFLIEQTGKRIASQIVMQIKNSSDQFMYFMTRNTKKLWSTTAPSSLNGATNTYQLKFGTASANDGYSTLQVHIKVDNSRGSYWFPSYTGKLMDRSGVYDLEGQYVNGANTSAIALGEIKIINSTYTGLTYGRYRFYGRTV